MQYLGEPTLKIFANPKYENTLSNFCITLEFIKQVSLYLNLFFKPIQYHATATNLFENIVINFKLAVAGKGPKLVLYSAHDTTVAMVLATFNLTNVNCINDRFIRNSSNLETCISEYPRFASNFILEIYQENNGVHTFSIVFNNVQRKIPFCNWSLTCPVDKFYEWVDSWKV